MSEQSIAVDENGDPLMDEAQFIAIREMTEEERAKLPEETKQFFDRTSRYHFGQRQSLESFEGMTVDGVPYEDWCAKNVQS
jgi:hypothetical protein